MRTDTLNAVNFMILSAIAVVLVFFVAQVCYYISINITQIEIEKYDAVKEYRKEIGNKVPVRNAYSKGFVGNWKAFLFPPKVQKHQPMEYSMEKEKIVCRPMKATDDRKKK